MKKAVVSFIFDDKGWVLLLKRPPDHPLFPNQWCLPGGKLEGWEDMEDAANGEAIQETGVSMRIFQDTGHRMADTHYMIHVFACLRIIKREEVTATFPNREHTEYGFFHPSKLPEGISELVTEYIQSVQ